MIVYSIRRTYSFGGGAFMVVDDEEIPMNFDGLTNEELLEFYGKIEEHIKYLNNKILVPDEEENE